MLAVATVNNTEQTVYTVPAGKNAMIYLSVFSPNASSLTVKINNVVYFSSQSVDFFQEKFLLNAGDAISIATAGQVNVFVYGMEVAT